MATKEDIAALREENKASFTALKEEGKASIAALKEDNKADLESLTEHLASKKDVESVKVWFLLILLGVHGSALAIVAGMAFT